MKFVFAIPATSGFKPNLHNSQSHDSAPPSGLTTLPQGFHTLDETIKGLNVIQNKHTMFVYIESQFVL